MIGNWKGMVLGVAVAAVSSEASGQLIVAHRGASHDAPENTIAAFKLAWEQQADGIEADFHLTGDGQIVCIHDYDTERVSGQKLVVAKTSLETLRTMEAGRWKGTQWAGEPIPTIKEVLAVVPPGKWLFIELKTGPEIVAPLVAHLRGYQGDRDKLVIISFHGDTIARCQELLPDVRAHWLTGFKQDEQSGSWGPTAEAIAETVRSRGADGVGMQGRRQVVTPQFLERLRDAGVSEFHAWTIDEPADALFFAAQGAFGITTNRPAVIRQALQGDS